MNGVSTILNVYNKNEQLFSKTIGDLHIHVNDQEYKKEITVALYDPSGKISQFSRGIQKLILEDK